MACLPCLILSFRDLREPRSSGASTLVLLSRKGRMRLRRRRMAQDSNTDSNTDTDAQQEKLAAPASPGLALSHPRCPT